MFQHPFPTALLDADEDGFFALPTEPARCYRCHGGLTLLDSTTRDALGDWHTRCFNLSMLEYEIAMQDAEDLALCPQPAAELLVTLAAAGLTLPELRASRACLDLETGCTELEMQGVPRRGPVTADVVATRKVA
jgi:hypothetical protein